jgi:hypothetical protein
MTLDIPSLIERGCEETEPIQASLYATESEHDLPEEATKACALGAALVASDSARFDRIADHLSTTRIEEDELPAHVDLPPYTKVHSMLEKKGEANLYLVMTTLNDRTDMSRQAIAEWLRTLPDPMTTVEFEVPTNVSARGGTTPATA